MQEPLAVLAPLLSCNLPTVPTPAYVTPTMQAVFLYTPTVLLFACFES